MMEDDRPPEGVMWRTVVTVAVFLVWLVWLLLWWAFWSGDLTIAQRFAVSIVGVLVLGAVLAAVWLPFSMRHGDERERWGAARYRWRVVASVVGFLALAGVLAWLLWEPWKDFTFCQSLVVIVVMVIGAGVMMTPVWMRRGRERPTERVVVLEDFDEGDDD